MQQLLQKIGGSAPTYEDTIIDAGIWSHFVSLTFPKIENAVSYLPAIRRGADALELRVDLLEDISPLSLHSQIALLREQCPLPLIFTVRTDGQIGKFPSHDPTLIFNNLKEGLRAGAEWVDVEACWPDNITSEFCSLAKSKYLKTSRLLGSYHVTTPRTPEELYQIFKLCTLKGAATMTKVVSGATCDEHCIDIHTVGSSHEKETGLPYIGLCLGLAGQLSRVLNKRFTPVSHPVMAAAAPGQLSAEELMSRRAALQLDGAAMRNYYLFGSPISQSLSPAMHNSAYAALLLPHNYSLAEQPAGSCAAYDQIFAQPTFGGASVTIPHKEAIQPMLDDITGAAKSIGAVNTVVVSPPSTPSSGTQKKSLVGYNTDWIGIRRPVLRRLQQRGVKWEGGGYGLVIGAGTISTNYILIDAH